MLLSDSYVAVPPIDKRRVRCEAKQVASAVSWASYLRCSPKLIKVFVDCLASALICGYEMLQGSSSTCSFCKSSRRPESNTLR